MRVLITVGAGFLGSHISDLLLQQGHDVINMNNFIIGRPENIAHLMGHDRLTFIKYNLCDYLHVDGTLDAVMHFASPASPQDYLEFPTLTNPAATLAGAGEHRLLGNRKSQPLTLPRRCVFLPWGYPFSACSRRQFLVKSFQKKYATLNPSFHTF